MNTKFYDNSIFADNLRMFLARKNMNASELARAVGVSKSVTSDWLKGKSLPRVDKIDKICVVLNCSRDDLSCSSESKSNEEFDALEEDIINRFRMLNNQQKIAVYNSLNAIFGGFGV